MRRGSDRGFTLVEAVITVAIIALAMGVVLAYWGSAEIELRTTSAKLAGTIQASYDGASLSGQIHRLAFSFEEPVVKVEMTEQLLSFSQGENPLVRGARNAAAPSGLESMVSMFMQSGFSAEEEGGKDEEVKEEPPTALTALLGLAEPPGSVGGATFSGTEHDLELEDGVRLLDIWVEGMEEPKTEGAAYLYFFPHGYTQAAIIHLEDDDGRVYTIRVHALTGKTEIFGEYKEDFKK